VARGLVEFGKGYEVSLRFIPVGGWTDWRDAPGDGRPGAVAGRCPNGCQLGEAQVRRAESTWTSNWTVVTCM
jgi:hypothetical protein